MLSLTLNTADHSSAVKELRLSADGSVAIEWHNRYTSTHTGVRKRDMLRLLDKRVSFGRWVNTYVL